MQVASAPALSSQDFARIRELLHARAGISLADNKQALVSGRLHRRLVDLHLPDFAAYLHYIGRPENQQELRRAVDLLTTNETYFWREPQHFERVRAEARRAAAERRDYRVWSAACSSGEEPYTLAMVLQSLCDEGLPLRWAVQASDLSERMLERAVRGHYPLERAGQLPPELLRRFCLRGTGEQAGTLLVEPALRERVAFARINLIERLPDIGSFDAIFLRNVMIYFDSAVKQTVLKAVCSRLREGGLLFVGLSESLHGVVDFLEAAAPGVQRLRVRP